MWAPEPGGTDSNPGSPHTPPSCQRPPYMFTSSREGRLTGRKGKGLTLIIRQAWQGVCSSQLAYGMGPLFLRKLPWTGQALDPQGAASSAPLSWAELPSERLLCPRHRCAQHLLLCGPLTTWEQGCGACLECEPLRSGQRCSFQG